MESISSSSQKPSSSSATFEQDQQLFTDTLLKIQIQSALAKEYVQNKKSPLPLLAQSCALVDNLPTTENWTHAQVQLINSLKIDLWKAFADACVAVRDLIQAEASLARLAMLQETGLGPLSLRSSKTKAKNSKNSVDIITIPSTADGPTSIPPTKEQIATAYEVIETWKKQRQVYIDMGKNNMVFNFQRRIDSMKKRLESDSVQVS
ncbi:hypothetical protein BX616_000455 [Lobosporangium transversale]|uniref:Uncharacterized protein n=1 Tax=Lobosporangium transversale TaxID=64571 RepID=A0A1Y2GL25_9FUNG|nr:hypothetical protein BCR41DRAFT_386882 [Lobosporangium transversale]KAF9907338.1 hypothetical protein BX616_000455 [Lobosporangium transversale]ORZ14312.1 hypothetical protein BCR41DRAFT_386882 [Lobosporangium transversale]|eukprot:XP_021880790.1 hypothetical protein BCR41DRAFT_386882 [Lobosporangium transversale]